MTPPAVKKLDEGLAELRRIEDFRASEAGVAERRTGSVDASSQLQLDIVKQELARQNSTVGGGGFTGSATASAPSFTAAPGGTTFSSSPASGAAGYGGAGATFNSTPAAVDPGASLAARREMSNILSQQTSLSQSRNDLQAEYQTLQGEYNLALRSNDERRARDLDTKLQNLQARINTANLETSSLNAQAANFAGRLIPSPAPVGNANQRSQKTGLRGLDPVVADDGTFRSGDSLELIVREDPSLNGNFAVRNSGLIHPDLGRIELIGMSHQQAEMAIKAMLESSMLRTATVTVERIPGAQPVVRPLYPTDYPVRQPVQPAAPIKRDIVYLAGEFLTPGPLLVPPGVTPTLLQTIIRSGGVTPSGDMMRVKLLRVVEGRGSVEEINVAAILSGQEPPEDIVLMDGDIVVIPPFAPVVYVTGNVERPGTLRLFQDETLTAYAAILRAGGFSRFAALTRVYVVRDLGNGEKAHLPIDIRDVQKGRVPDVVLQGKDIVIVPERFFSF